MVFVLRCDESPDCGTCGRPVGRWRAALGVALCDSCGTAGRDQGDREPVRWAEALVTAFDEVAHAARTAAPVPDPGAGGVTCCRSCGSVAEWRRTVRGRWILIEPGVRPAGSVPAGKRWRIAGDGTAVNLRAGAPSDACRVSHFDICRSRSAPPAEPVRSAPAAGPCRAGARPSTGRVAADRR